MCNVFIWSSIELVVGRCAFSGGVSGICLCNIFGLVERTPCLEWTMCPIMVSSADGKYAVALARVSLVQVR